MCSWVLSELIRPFITHTAVWLKSKMQPFECCLLSKEAKKCLVGYDTWRMAKSSATLARTVVDPRLFMVVVDVEKIVGSVRRPSCNLAAVLFNARICSSGKCANLLEPRERNVAKKSLV
jgi:hypothetical protein